VFGPSGNFGEPEQYGQWKVEDDQKARKFPVFSLTTGNFSGERFARDYERRHISTVDRRWQRIILSVIP
jgi:hypothetical protein